MGDYLTTSKNATWEAFKSLFYSNSYNSIETFNTTFFSTSNFISNQAPTSIDTTNSYSFLFNPRTKATEGHNSKAKG
jgi:hypothetical protein